MVELLKVKLSQLILNLQLLQSLSSFLHFCENVQETANPYIVCVMRKPAFCVCENTGIGQLCGDSATDQCLCFAK